MSVLDDLIGFRASEAAKLKAGFCNVQDVNPARDNREWIKATKMERMNTKTSMAMLKLQNPATDSKYGLLRQCASTLFNIPDQYQRDSANMGLQNDPLQHSTDFRHYNGSCTATLLQVFQLLPEAFRSIFLL